MRGPENLRVQKRNQGLVIQALACDLQAKACSTNRYDDAFRAGRITPAILANRQ
jgi:hypothetical protein